MGKLKRKTDEKFWKFIDVFTDLKVCKTPLVKYVPSVFRDDENGVGATGSQATAYIILKEIFSHIELSDSDNFVDVGCGKGRVLAYLLSKGFKGNLTGIELNEEVAKTAQNWADRYDNVNIIAGDAFKQHYNDFSVAFMCRPFLPKTFLQFIEYFECELDHKITFIYWVDQQSGYMLKDRVGWTMKCRGKIYKKFGVPVAPVPQGYSIWEYDPNKKD